MTAGGAPLYWAVAAGRINRENRMSSSKGREREKELRRRRKRREERIKNRIKKAKAGRGK